MLCGASFPLWFTSETPSYFAASCGGALLSIIKAYVESQRRPD
jgi:REP element-mobilizing transposase RayT